MPPLATPRPMLYKNRMRRKALFSVSAATAALFLAGCNTDSTPPAKPLVAAPATPLFTASTQPADVVAELSTLKITRSDLDDFLYKTYGLRMLFDLVELDLAKTTLQQSGGVVTPADIQAERQTIIANICGEDTPPSRYEEVFSQFLDREHITRAEFDLKIIETDAYLRKIVTPLVVGKLPEQDVKLGFEQLYGSTREIEDIELANVREAEIARQRLKTEPFERVAVEMSIDQLTAASGGKWQPFSAQDPRVPQVIKDAAFSLQKGQVSDVILDPDSHYHLIKVVNVIEPKLVKYDDVKDEVREQLEAKLIDLDMKKLREELRIKRQQELKFDEPILSSQWDAIVEQATSRTSDRELARQKLNQTTTHPASTGP
jgi:hypothetical protein